MQAEITKSGQFLYFYIITHYPKILSNCSINSFYGTKNLEYIIFKWPKEVVLLCGCRNNGNILVHQILYLEVGIWNGFVSEWPSDPEDALLVVINHVGLATVPWLGRAAAAAASDVFLDNQSSGSTSPLSRPVHPPRHTFQQPKTRQCTLGPTLLGVQVHLPRKKKKRKS